MKKIIAGSIMIAVVMVALASIGSRQGANAADKTGEALFKQHCTLCHPDGGNIVNPNKTLHKKDREANNVRKEDDIMKIMRNPGPGMTVFDTKTIPDKEARAIAEYILKTFK